MSYVSYVHNPINVITNFDTSKLDDYYVLTNHKEDEMVVGVRDGVENDYNKRNMLVLRYLSFHK